MSNDIRVPLMVAASARRRPATTAKGELSRAAILRAAAPLFAEQGYRGASLAKVAEAVGLTQPGLLHHFPSKEHLLLALLEERYHQDGKLLAGQSETGLHLLDALQEIVERNQSTPEAVQLFAVLVTESISGDHPGHEFFVERYRKVRHRMARELRSGKASGQIRDDIELRLLVPVIVAVMDGLQNQWLLDDEIDMLASFRLFCQLITDGLTQVPSRGDAPAPSQPRDAPAS